MKPLALVLILVSLLLGGCVSKQHSIDYNTDRYSYEELERRFGKLAATSDHSGFSSTGAYGIWERPSLGGQAEFCCKLRPQTKWGQAVLF
jgi:hypothetical protein